MIINQFTYSQIVPKMHYRNNFYKHSIIPQIIIKSFHLYLEYFTYCTKLLKKSKGICNYVKLINNNNN